MVKKVNDSRHYHFTGYRDKAIANLFCATRRALPPLRRHSVKKGAP
jgi:hypothetical protein